VIPAGLCGDIQESRERTRGSHSQIRKCIFNAIAGSKSIAMRAGQLIDAEEFELDGDHVKEL
jgi:hypothetical protein